MISIEWRKNIDVTTERIESLMLQMKNLSVNIAHDLKTPLARMRVASGERTDGNRCR